MIDLLDRSVISGIRNLTYRYMIRLASRMRARSLEKEKAI